MDDDEAYLTNVRHRLSQLLGNSEVSLAQENSQLRQLLGALRKENEELRAQLMSYDNAPAEQHRIHLWMGPGTSMERPRAKLRDILKEDYIELLIDGLTNGKLIKTLNHAAAAGTHERKSIIILDMAEGNAIMKRVKEILTRDKRFEMIHLSSEAAAEDLVSTIIQLRNKGLT